MTTVRERPRAAVARPRAAAGQFVALLLLVAACWGALLATTPQATGDPVLLTTSPGNTELVKSPDAVVLTFDRPVPAALATVRVLDPGGRQVVFTRPTHPDGREDAISVPMPAQRNEGTYAVAWTAPSSGLEPVSGSFTFDVSRPIQPGGIPAIETTRDPVVAAAHLAARALAVAAMVLLAGLAFFVASLGPPAVRARVTRRLIKVAWWLLVGSTLVALVSFGPYAAWVPWHDALDPRLLSAAVESTGGAALLARLATLVPATLGLVLLVVNPPATTAVERCSRGAAVLGCASAVFATWPLADPRSLGSPSPLALAADIGLLVALAIPVGGLVLLRFPVGRHRHAVARLARSVVGCAVLLAVAGTAQAWLGHGLGLLPAGALALAAVLAVFAWLLSRRAAGGSAKARSTRLGHQVVGVAGAAALITATTATLIALDPGQSAHAAGPVGQAPAAIREQAPPARLTYDTGTPSGQGSLDLVLIPTTDRLDVRVSVLGPHGAHTAVSIALKRDNRTEPVPLDRAGPGHWTGRATVPERGRWQLALTLRAADGSTHTVGQPIDVR
ncbi:Copper resistance protein CopC [Actinokineospora spheciospongiae]|uniref:Copper resistance protein CopC n=1 Tax=Actinokineospora spheciospongiae TaxID=909613 RepID=W7IL89_9PSEU|nr:copper resistance CopC family protein [Actinokineospora spheciospongiae]EWC61103.1 Copper resistance protein CopC [Actinokineospora spheciospongiae]